MSLLDVHATDQEIVDALQIAPRASWASVGKALGVSEITVARRWNRLESNGLAWTSVALHPALSHGAFIEVRCEAKYLDGLLASLGNHPDVITVGQTTGDYNLFCIAVGTSVVDVLQCVHGGLPELLDAVHVRISLFRQMTGGVDWRQGILSVSDEKNLQPERTQDSQSSAPDLSIHDRELFLFLGASARRSATELARKLGKSPGVVRRRVEQLEAKRQIVFRCDVARPAFDLPLGMLVLLKALPLEAEDTARQLGQWRETRFCASVVSRANIIMIVGLHDLANADNILGRLSVEHGQVEVVDQRVITRMSKIYGRILDAKGKSVGLVPVDPWIRHATRS